jgi:hypothetical protein
MATTVSIRNDKPALLRLEKQQSGLKDTFYLVEEDKG